MAEKETAAAVAVAAEWRTTKMTSLCCECYCQSEENSLLNPNIMLRERESDLGPGDDTCTVIWGEF